MEKQFGQSEESEGKKRWQSRIRGTLIITEQERKDGFKMQGLQLVEI